jgi:hypothetical protein
MQGHPRSTCTQTLPFFSEKTKTTTQLLLQTPNSKLNTHDYKPKPISQVSIRELRRTREETEQEKENKQPAATKSSSSSNSGSSSSTPTPHDLGPSETVFTRQFLFLHPLENPSVSSRGKILTLPESYAIGQ